MSIRVIDRQPHPIRDWSEPVGELRVDVKMFNAIDEGIVRRGDLVSDQVRSCEAKALVDTGAVRCCIPVYVAEQLGLGTTGRSLAAYADGREEVVEITEPIRFEIEGRSTTEQALVLGDEVLIGQTALETTDLWADCREQRLVPNPSHPDQPVFKIK